MSPTVRFVYPPDHYPYQDLKDAGLTTWEWLRQSPPEILSGPNFDPDVLGAHDLRQCTQEVGEVMVIPEYWSHATLNIGITIGLGARQDLSAKIAKKLLGEDPSYLECVGASKSKDPKRRLQGFECIRNLRPANLRHCDGLINAYVWLSDYDSIKREIKWYVGSLGTQRTNFTN
jgi:hypothetical protein